MQIEQNILQQIKPEVIISQSPTVAGYPHLFFDVFICLHVFWFCVLIVFLNAKLNLSGVDTMVAATPNSTWNWFRGIFFNDLQKPDVSASF